TPDLGVAIIVAPAPSFVASPPEGSTAQRRTAKMATSPNRGRRGQSAVGRETPAIRGQVLDRRRRALAPPQRSKQQGPQQPIAQRTGRCKGQTLKRVLLRGCDDRGCQSSQEGPHQIAVASRLQKRERCGECLLDFAHFRAQGKVGQYPFASCGSQSGVDCVG